jgi:Helicase conserved C-terminal domain
MQRFLQPDSLARVGLSQFDAWAACFGEPVTALEIAPDGSGYRVHTRFSRFVNVPELIALFGEVADIQTQEMLQLPVPAIAGGGPQTIVAEICEAQKAYVDSLVERAPRIHQGGVDPRTDNMLAITSAGRKAALDIRLVAPAERDFAGSKVNLAVQKITDVWRRTREARLTQLVFCDLSVPTGGRGFSVYEDVRDKLIAHGIPADEIAFVQHYDADAAKAEIFQRVRTGKVRILLGSTARMGMGVNVQCKLVALHDLDAPWRPADMEQRLGRGVRQGNENPTIEVYRYVTNGTFDAYIYQCLERKQQFIAQVMVRDAAIRTVEDAALTALSYAEVKALASGNPLVLEKAGVDAEVLKLTRAKNTWLRERHQLQRKLEQEGERVRRNEARAEAIRQDLAARHDVSGKNFAIELEGQRFNNRLAAGQRLRAMWQNMKHELTRDFRSVVVGQFAGFALELGARFGGEPALRLRGQSVYEVDLANTDQGVMQAIEYGLVHMEHDLEQTTRQIEQARSNIEAAAVELERPFAQEIRLRDRLQRQREIDASLKPEAVERTAGVAESEVSVALAD